MVGLSVLFRSVLLASFTLVSLLAATGCAVKSGENIGASGARSPSRAAVFVVQPDAQGRDAAVGLDAAAFAGRAGAADYILIGEGHTVACDHGVQARLLEILARTCRPPALGLEMIGADRQEILDRFFNTSGAGAPVRAAAATLAALANDLDWPQTWGHSFELYAPIFRVALAARLPVYGLNIPPKVMAAFRKSGVGGLSAEQKKFLPRQVVPPAEAQKKALGEEFERHAAMMRSKKSAEKTVASGLGALKSPAGQAEARERFFHVQSLWDSKMAERAVEVRQATGRPVVVLAGAAHVENGWGIAHRLRTLDPHARVLLIAPWRGGKLPGVDNADVFFFCADEHKSRLGFTVEWREDAPSGAVAVVTSVAPGTRADKAGLAEHDAIVAAGGKPLAGLADLHVAAIQAKTAGKNLALTLLRSGKRLEVVLDLSAEAGPAGP